METTKRHQVTQRLHGYSEIIKGIFTTCLCNILESLSLGIDKSRHEFKITVQRLLELEIQNKNRIITFEIPQFRFYNT